MLTITKLPTWSRPPCQKELLNGNPCSRNATNEVIYSGDIQFLCGPHTARFETRVQTLSDLPKVKK